MLDHDDVTNDATAMLNDLLHQLEQGVPAGSLQVSLTDSWGAGTNASLLLALAERVAPRRDYLLAVSACARPALAARSYPCAVLEAALDVVEGCARGDASQDDARHAASNAWSLTSHEVAGVDDEVAMAVCEACDLAAGGRFVLYGPDPAFRTAWALAMRMHDPRVDRAATERVYREQQAALADVVRTVIATV